MKKYIMNIVLLWTITWLSSCKVARDTAAPAIDLPSAYRSGQAVDTAGTGDLSWQRFFNDALLQSLIDSALVRNYDMLIADKNIEESQLLLKQAKWGYVPNTAL